MYNGATLLKIVKGAKDASGNDVWIAMHWDKRDDDMIRFQNVGDPSRWTVNLTNGQAGSADVTFVSYQRMLTPRDVHSACFWFQPAPDGRVGVAFSARGVGLTGVWRVHIAAPGATPGASPVMLLNVIAQDYFQRNKQGSYEYLWTPGAAQDSQQFGTLAQF